jgi:hypothetical protein
VWNIPFLKMVMIKRGISCDSQGFLERIPGGKREEEVDYFAGPPLQNPRILL